MYAEIVNDLNVTVDRQEKQLKAKTAQIEKMQEDAKLQQAQLDSAYK